MQAPCSSGSAWACFAKNLDALDALGLQLDLQILATFAAVGIAEAWRLAAG